MDKKLNHWKKLISIFLLFFTAFAIVLTASRSAWIGLILSLPLIYGLNIIFWLIPIVCLLMITFLFYNFEISPQIITNLIERITPGGVLKKFQPEFYSEYSSPRINIYIFAAKFLFLRPFFGWGAGSFGVYFFLNNQTFISHSHSLPLDLAHNYGLPASLVFLIIVILLLNLSFKNLFLQLEKENKESYFFYYERAWFASAFILLASQLVDVQYYDAKISIAFWILFAGIRSLSGECKIK